MPIEIENRTQQVGVILLLVAAGMSIGIFVIGFIFNGFPGGEKGIFIYVLIMFVLLALGIILKEPKEPVHISITG